MSLPPRPQDASGKACGYALPLDCPQAQHHVKEDCVATSVREAVREALRDVVRDRVVEGEEPIGGEREGIHPLLLAALLARREEREERGEEFHPLLLAALTTRRREREERREEIHPLLLAALL